MHKTRILLIALFSILVFSQCMKPIEGEVKGLDPKIEKRIDSLMALMTLEEKIGQLTLFTTDWGSTGPTIREGYQEDIRKGLCGALFNSHTVEFTRELQRIAVEESRLKIPLLFGYDVIHGYKTIFPIPLGESASWDTSVYEISAAVSAAEAAAAGLNWTFAPMVDVSRDPRWGRVMEGAGEDPFLASVFAVAKVRGFQGSSFAGTDKILACVKHFAAYGAPIGGRDYNSVDMSERTLREVYLPPYEAAVKEGVWTVMTSFNDVDGVPATCNSWLLTDILRNEWGFQGFVVTDYTSIMETVNHGVVADAKEAGEAALNAGVDMDMQSAIFQQHLKQSVEEGKVSLKAIDDAVRRILRAKFVLGLFDNPYKFHDAQREKDVILSAEHQEIARDVARKSIVLLRNESVLPLKKDLKSIALIGPLADDKENLTGAWSGAGEGRHCVSVLEGLQNKLSESGTRIVHAKGCDINGTDKSGFAAALNAARSAEVIIVAVGEEKGMSGEAKSYTNINLPGVQEDLVKALVATGKPVVVVLMNGRPLTIPWLAENSPALLETWWLGTQAGNAIADVIFGDYNPSGKLTMSFPRNTGQIPVFYSEKNTGRPFNPESMWTSKYIDSPNTPQFPFGFGLSYTSFDISEPIPNKTEFKKGEELTIEVTVSNTGNYDGEEVVQLYIRDLVGSVTRPVKELKGFQKIHLNAGEQKKVTFSITEKELAFYTRSMKFESEPGEFDIMVGNSSDSLKTVRVKMTE